MDTCTHERRPGTTVCLHCLHAARVAARARRKRVVLRATAILAAVATVGAAGVLGATALRGRHRQPAAQSVAQPAAQPQRLAAASSAEIAPPSDTSAVVQQDGTVAPTAPTPTPPLTPVIPTGTTMIAEGVSAVRTDSGVTLSFDAPLTRTRIPDKFERFLRATLEQVYGRDVDSVLAKVPTGSIVASQGKLLYDLPTSGIHIPVQDAWQLAIYPEIRPGQDGPLVIRYRVAVVSGIND
jgi:hypothetical protein